MEWYFLNAKTGVGQKLSIRNSIPNEMSFKKEREILSRQTKLTEFIANRPTVQKLFRKFRQKKNTSWKFGFTQRNDESEIK